VTSSAGALIGDAAARLAEAGVDDPRRDARRLLAHALGLAAGTPLPAGDMPVTDAVAAAFRQAMARRCARQPVSQIIGRRAFWGRDFTVTADVLDPRPDTETLIAAALSGPVPTRILDLGTGSGILAVTLLAEWPGAGAVASDISAAALDVAAGNAVAHGVAARLDLRRTDWFDGIEGRFDLIVSNPPYIPAGEIAALAPEVAKWEPRLALDGGVDGLDPYRRIAGGLAHLLAPGGRAILEFGAGQGEAVRGIFASAGWVCAQLHDDLTGRPRCIELAAMYGI
jgi:release factor glutamine methyltransferase